MLSVLAVAPNMSRAQIANIVVTNAASFRSGVPATGSIGTIFCTGLTITGVVSAPGVPLPFNLSGVTVTVGGVAAPLFAVADFGGYQQINFQVPLETAFGENAGGTTTQVTVSQNGIQGTAAANLGSVVGDFFRSGTTQFGIFQHSADYSLVTASNPAKGGETIIGYATGLPQPQPSPAIGQPTPASPLYYVPQVPLDPYSLNGLFVKDSSGISFSLVNSTGNYDPNGPLPFMGLTPGAVGLYQVNFVLPADIASGNASIDIRNWYCTAFPFGGCDAPGAVLVFDSQPVLIPVP